MNCYWCKENISFANLNAQLIKGKIKKILIDKEEVLFHKSCYKRYNAFHNPPWAWETEPSAEMQKKVSNIE